MILFLVLTLVALLVEATFGYPQAVFRAIGHPVTWIGALIATLDRRLNHESDSSGRRRALGCLALLVLVMVTGAVGLLLSHALVGFLPLLPGMLVLAIIASTLLAQRSLHEHVEAVADALDRDGIAGGRAAVSQIVGRDPESLDEAGVGRAAIESLAENFSDGIVAPAFWLAVGGLAGGLLYKAINTADSMIGHRSARHLAFGWASARLDDLVNLPASRLAALWLVLAAGVTAGADPRGAVRAVRRDARHHTSPNAGWPEAAMAGALGLKLAGPRVYASSRIDAAFMGDGRASVESADIRRALSLYRRACIIQFAAFGGLLVVLLTV